MFEDQQDWQDCKTVRHDLIYGIVFVRLKENTEYEKADLNTFFSVFILCC